MVQKQRWNTFIPVSSIDYLDQQKSLPERSANKLLLLQLLMMCLFFFALDYFILRLTQFNNKYNNKNFVSTLIRKISRKPNKIEFYSFRFSLSILRVLMVLEELNKKCILIAQTNDKNVLNFAKTIRQKNVLLCCQKFFHKL